MKIEIISRDDIGAGVVYDFWMEGNDILYYGKNKKIFEGLGGIKKTKSYESVDFYFFDDTMFGPQIEKMRKDGKVVFGGSTYADKLELDRAFFFEEAKRLGATVPETHEFHTITDGIDFLKNADGRWVFKPSGKLSDEKNLTYVGLDIIEFMEDVKNAYGNKIKYVLQRYIEGVEVAISGLVVDGRVVGGYFVNFEVKPFMKFSNLNTGEMGTIIKHFDEVPILQNAFDAFAKELKNYRCWFDLNGILTEDGKYYLLEPTSRIGVPTVSILNSMITDRKSDFYYHVAKGDIENFGVLNEWFVGLVLAIPPFPYHIDCASDLAEKEIVYGRFEDLDVHYYELMMKDGDLWTSGPTGFVAVVVGKGENHEKANAEAVRKCRSIKIPEKFFRSDLGEDERPAKFEKIIENFK